MALVGINQMLRDARQRGYAVPGFCVWNAEMIRTTLQVAAQHSAPVILMSGPGEFPLLPPAVLGRIARAEAQPLQIPVAIHLDHGNSLEMVAECLDAGFTSVMLDASDRPFAENVRLTGRAAEMARQAGADSEGEIGAVGRANDISIEGPHAGTLTDPDQAAQFVAETGVDALAKVNVASALEHAFRLDLAARFADPDDTPWIPLQMVKALEAVAPVVRYWLELTGATGQAKS